MIFAGLAAAMINYIIASEAVSVIVRKWPEPAPVWLGAVTLLAYVLVWALELMAVAVIKCRRLGKELQKARIEAAGLKTVLEAGAFVNEAWESATRS
ncbi:MAG: hypothetical protein QME76_07105 [Bacillota bacterium]|nr:hypothetical protein [Bacillota bacterium]